MANQGDVDPLIDVKNLYFLGNYQHVINEAQKLSGLTPEQNLLKDIFVYRAYIAQRKYAVVMDEITGSSPQELQSLRTYAEFLSAPAKRDAITEKVDKQLNSGFDTDDVTKVLIASTIHYHMGNFESTLRYLHQMDNLECSALTIQALLAYDRVDLAKKELKAMQDKDEDALLTQLATAWVNLCVGSEKLQEAFYIVQEMIDKYGGTPMLFNLLASCYIAQEKYEEAESMLQDALEKDPNNVDTLINLFTNARFLGKAPEVANRYLSQLKESNPHHPFVEDIYKKESDFERVSKIFFREVA